MKLHEFTDLIKDEIDGFESFWTIIHQENPEIFLENGGNL